MVGRKACSSAVLVLCSAISVTWWFDDLTAPAPPEPSSFNTLDASAPAVSLLQHSKTLLSNSLVNNHGSMTARGRKKDPENDFTDLGAGTCMTKAGKVPNHMHWGSHFKDRCAQYCLSKTLPGSWEGKADRCWGYTITQQGTCYIWREGPLAKFPWESDPERHCYVVSALLHSPQPEACQKSQPYSVEACKDAAERAGLILGSKYEHGIRARNHSFTSGKYPTKGCYTYSSGKYAGHAYYGTGGSETDRKAIPEAPKIRVPGHDQCGGGDSDVLPDPLPAPEPPDEPETEQEVILGPDVPHPLIDIPQPLPPPEAAPEPEQPSQPIIIGPGVPHPNVAPLPGPESPPESPPESEPSPQRIIGSPGQDEDWNDFGVN